jgi:hypothetical protein
MAGLKAPPHTDGVEIGDVDFAEAVRVDICARQLYGIADRLILIASAAARVDGLAVAQVDDANHACYAPWPNDHQR